METLVSVIVRTKDRPRLLEDALRSICIQTYRPIEMILVNDGGCELNQEEMRALLGDIPMRYLRHPASQGRSAALNSGLGMCEGAYIAFLDDDDIYYPSAIQNLVSASMESGDVAVYGQVVCKTWHDGGGEAAGDEVVLGEPFNFGKLIFENFIPTNSLLVPRKSALEVGLFDTRFEIFEDWDWIIRMAAIQEPKFVETLVGEYRIFASSTLTGKGGEKYQRVYREKLLEKHMEKASAKDFLDHVQRSVDRAVLEKDKRVMEQVKAIRNEEKEASERVIREIHASHSWKVTRPLRWLGFQTRRVLGVKRDA